MADPLLIDIERRFAGGPVVRARLAPVPPGCVTVLFGPSGAGKSTILRCVAGLDRPDGGTIRCGGRTWTDAATFVPPQERGVGFLFQDYALFPHLSVAENVGFGVRDATRRAAVVPDLLRRFGLVELARRRPREISGGQAQRVALARALAPRPAVLLLDEPLSALDGPTRAEVRRELRDVLRGLEVPCLVVTHDRAEALSLGGRLAVLVGGELLQEGTCEEVLGRPASGRVARALGIDNVLDARVTEGVARVGALAVPAGATTGDVVVCTHAEDVEIGPVGAEFVAGTVTDVEAEGPTVRVVVDVGLRIVARVRRLQGGRFERGQAVGVRLRPEHIHVAPA